MLKQLRKSKLTKVILAAVMAMSVYGTAFAAPGNIEPAGTTNTNGYEVHVTHSITTGSNGLKDASIIHPALEHSSSCGEYVHDTNLTIGNLNKVFDALVDNDQKLYNDIQAEATARKNADIVSGKVTDNNLVLVGGDNKTKATIDVTSLKKDTYVTSGSYNSDSQTITLKQNEGQKDINIKLDNIAKADDVTNLENRVSKNETNITNLQGDVTNIKTDVTNIKTDITNIQGDVTDLEGRVTTNEGNITNLQGDVTNIKTDVTKLDNRVTTNETNITNLQGDVTDLEGRVTTNEGNITNLQGDVTKLDNRVTTNETNITNLQGDVTDLEGRVSTNETNITKLDNRVTTNETNITKLDNRVTTNETNITTLQGEVLESGHMDGNTLVLVKNNQSTVEVEGIATTDDVDEVQQQVDENRENIQKESSERKAEDARLDNRLDGVEQEIGDINGRLDRLDGKIEKGVALAIAHASLKPLDYDPECKWSGAMGVGSYKGKNALAAGVFYRESKDVMYNISVSTCQGETGVGAGFSFRFK